MSPRKVWQVPVSSGTAQPAHFFAEIGLTDKLYRSACGRWFNPGFAERDPSRLKCVKCKARA